jgi:hypothetical protein
MFEAARFLCELNRQLHVVILRLSDALDPDLPQQSRGQALAQKCPLEGDDGQAAVHRLPRRRVSGEGRTVQVHIHGIKEAEKLLRLQPRHDAKVRPRVEAFPAEHIASRACSLSVAQPSLAGEAIQNSHLPTAWAMRARRMSSAGSNLIGW